MYWYEDEIKQLESKTISPKKDKSRVVFFGSSSLRMWDGIEADFEEFDVINQAFGGSTLAACCWFFKRIIPQCNADIIILYAGDNDLGDGRHPEEVYLDFKTMMALIEESCGEIPVAFVSIKFSVSRANLFGSIEYTNKIIKEEIARNYPRCTYVDVTEAMKTDGNVDKLMFEQDGLHLSAKGYKVWKHELKSQFLNQLKAAK